MRSVAAFAAVALGVGVVLAAAFSTPVFADPAGPTDYRSEVVSVDPATADIEVEIIGGDSFVQLTAQPGTDVIVVGYRGEPYLWFRPDGTVVENRNAPTTYQNLSRYGSDGAGRRRPGGRARLAPGGVGSSMGVARPSGALDAGRRGRSVRHPAIRFSRPSFRSW